MKAQKCWFCNSFLLRTVKSLGILNGAQLFSLNKQEFVAVSPEEGENVYSHIMAEKTLLEVCSLFFFLFSGCTSLCVCVYLQRYAWVSLESFVCSALTYAQTYVIATATNWLKIYNGKNVSNFKLNALMYKLVFKMWSWLHLSGNKCQTQSIWSICNI